jgi:hypothetical protein
MFFSFHWSGVVERMIKLREARLEAGVRRICMARMRTGVILLWTGIKQIISSNKSGYIHRAKMPVVHRLDEIGEIQLRVNYIVRDDGFIIILFVHRFHRPRRVILCLIADDEAAGRPRLS